MAIRSLEGGRRRRTIRNCINKARLRISGPNSMLHYYRSQVDKGAEGIVPSDIGNMLGLKPGTVMEIVHRARPATCRLVHTIVAGAVDACRA